MEGKTGFLYRLYSDKSTILPAISGFAFTTMGFLATIITFLFGLSERPFFRGFVKHGNMGNFLFFYFLTMGTMFATYFVSLAASAYRLAFDISVALVVVNALQLVLIGIICLNVTRKSLAS